MNEFWTSFFTTLVILVGGFYFLYRATHTDTPHPNDSYENEGFILIGEEEEPEESEDDDYSDD